MIQAHQTGLYLKEYFDKNGMTFDRINIETSPFIRCLMTSSQIAKALGVSEITINHQASEILSSYCFDSDPMQNIEYATCDNSYLQM